MLRDVVGLIKYESLTHLDDPASGLVLLLSCYPLLIVMTFRPARSNFGTDSSTSYTYIIAVKLVLTASHVAINKDFTSVALFEVRVHWPYVV